MVNWLVDLPTVVLFLLLAIVGFAFTIGLSWLIRRFIEDDVRTKSSTSVTTVVGVIAGLDAVLVTFVIVNEWQTLNDAQAHVSAEAAALTAASFDVSVLPEPARTTIRDALVAYDRSVVCGEILRRSPTCCSSSSSSPVWPSSRWPARSTRSIGAGTSCSAPRSRSWSRST
jgi:hypothetical protein